MSWSIEAVNRFGLLSGRGRTNTPAEDESASYDANMGRWARQGLDAAKSRYFWLIMATSNCMSEQLDRLLWVSQANAKWKIGQPANLAKLLWEHHDKIDAGLQSLIKSDVWGKLSDFLSGEPGADALQVAYTDAVVRLLLRLNCDFARRITKRLQDLSIAILWIARSERSLKCPQRFRVVTKILVTPDDKLPSTIRTAGQIKSSTRQRFSIIMLHARLVGLRPRPLVCTCDRASQAAKVT